MGKRRADPLQAELARLQEQLAAAVRQVEAAGAELAAAERRGAELAERLEASRRECEGLRVRALGEAELESLRGDRGAGARLAAVREELERARAAAAAEAAARDEWRRRAEEAEAAGRLERAGRADEARAARERAAAQERAAERAEAAGRAAAERGDQLARQLAEERAGRRAAEDERLKLLARVRGLEASRGGGLAAAWCLC